MGDRQVLSEDFDLTPEDLPRFGDTSNVDRLLTPNEGLAYQRMFDFMGEDMNGVDVFHVLDVAHEYLKELDTQAVETLELRACGAAVGVDTRDTLDKHVERLHKEADRIRSIIVKMTPR